MKQITALKLTCVATFVAALGVGCASSGYAKYDADSSDMNEGVGVSASADIGTDSDMDRSTTVIVDDDAEGAARATVSALSSNPETRATWVNKFPFYDQNWNMRVIETYTFAAPDPGIEIAARARTTAMIPGLARPDRMSCLERIGGRLGFPA